MSNKLYNVSDVDMGIAAQAISISFEDNNPELSKARTNWTAEYAAGFKQRVADTVRLYLGIDPSQVQRNATAAVYALITPAMSDVSFFKTQIDEDFKSVPARRTELLKSLGFTASLSKVQQGNQEALIKLLTTFKTNMTDALRTEISAKGVNPELIDRISGYATTINNANVSQETSKSGTKELSKEGIDAFNAIYTELIAICKIAAKYYHYEPLKRDLFTFSKVIANLGPNRKTKKVTAAKKEKAATV